MIDRWTCYINDREVKLITGDDFSKEYEMEDQQQFFRQKLSGTMKLLGGDFDWLNSQPYDTNFAFLLKLNGVDFYTGYFAKSDCKWDADNKIVDLEINPDDAYERVLAALDKEVDIIELAPDTEEVTVVKRPLIQLYVPGEEILSCFVGGTYWEQSCQAISDTNALQQTYYFALASMVGEINVTGDGTSAVNGTYAGEVTIDGTSGSGTFYNDNGLYKIKFYWGVGVYEGFPIPAIQYDIVEYQGEAVVYSTGAKAGTWDSATTAAGTKTLDIRRIDVWMRYLLDVDSIKGLNTYNIPTDDITDNNRNYRKCIGYAIDTVTAYARYSNDSTKYGKNDYGTYFVEPYSIYGQKFFPVSRHSWGNASLWFSFHLMDEYMEKEGRGSYILKDAWEVHSIINCMLNKFATGVTFENTPDYSEFLFSDRNPLTYTQFSLLVTQKSNLLVGDYDQPAQQAPGTLGDFLDMLKNTLKCYWFIEDNKLRIEHISWFMNGGTYTGQILGLDTTTLIDQFNKKPYSYGSNKFEYETVDLPEYIQFDWMDDVTPSFEGYPIEVESVFVNEGNVETVSVSKFTTDIDFILMNPAAISQEGFALFACSGNRNILDQSEATTSKDLDDSGNEIDSSTTDLSEYLGIQQTQVEVSGVTKVALYDVTYTSMFLRFLTITDNKVEIPPGGYAIRMVVNKSAWGDAKAVPRYYMPLLQRNFDGADLSFQNGYLSWVYLHPNFYSHDLPTRVVTLNDETFYASGVVKSKKQTIEVPMSLEVEEKKLVKTSLGVGQIEKIVLNLHSRTGTIDLKYEP